MVFSDFKNVAEVQQRFRIRYWEEIFTFSQNLDPPESFLRDFEFYREHIDVFSSEASRSEIVISPLLREIYKRYYQQYSFWVQKSLAIDDVLSGTPDYMISGRSELGKTVLEKPIIIIVAAKKNDFEQGWGQCLAELVASQKVNEETQRPVFGIVTDGNLWQFGKLVTDTFSRDPENFTIDQLPRLYGALDYLIQLAGQYNDRMEPNAAPGVTQHDG